MTHLVYAAHFEMPNLVQGWQDEEQIRVNDGMLQPAGTAGSGVALNLRHLTLLQGT